MIPAKVGIPPREAPARLEISPLREIDQQIGEHLRALYESVLSEPVPNRFLALIDELASEDTRSSRDASNEIDA